MTVTNTGYIQWRLRYLNSKINEVQVKLKSYPYQGPNPQADIDADRAYLAGLTTERHTLESQGYRIQE